MENENSHRSKFWTFWTTLPGVLTSIVALIGAIGGLYLTFKKGKEAEGPINPNPPSTENNSNAVVNPPDTTFAIIEFTKDTRGTWPHTGNGDRDMHTSDNDVVLPVCTTELTIINDRSIRLSVWFSVAETVGDKTKFEGTQIFTVYRAKDNMKIVGIKAPGGSLRRTFSDRSVGENHEERSFPDIGNSYFRRLTYQIDGKSGNDTGDVGVVLELDAEAVLVPRS